MRSKFERLLSGYHELLLVTQERHPALRVNRVRDSSITKSYRLTRVIFIVCVYPLLAACGLVNNNLSRHEYFVPMVGENLALQRKAYLCELTWSGPWPDTRTYSSVQLVEHRNNCSPIYNGTIIDELDVGTPLYLDHVYEPTEFGASGITAVGETSGHEFEYDWGGRLMPLNLAPWEEGPFDPNRCLGTIWKECKVARDTRDGSEQN